MVFIVVLCNIEPSCFALDWFSGVWVGHVVVLLVVFLVLGFLIR